MKISEAQQARTGGAGPTGPAGDDGPGGSGGPHQLLGFVRAVEGALDRVSQIPAWSMTADEQREALVLLHRIKGRLAEVEMRVLVAGDRNQVGAPSGRPPPPPG